MYGTICALTFGGTIATSKIESFWAKFGIWEGRSLSCSCRSWRCSCRASLRASSRFHIADRWQIH